MNAHTKTRLEHDVETLERDVLAQRVARMINAAPKGHIVCVTVRPPVCGEGEEQAESIAYASPAARSRAEAVLDAGRKHAREGRGKAPENPPLDALLYWVGHDREMLRMAAESASRGADDSGEASS